MRIGIDARPLAGVPTGIGAYLAGMIGALAGANHQHEFVLYSHRPIALPLPGPQWQARVQPGLRGTGPLWLQLHGARLARNDALDLFWGAHFLLPLTLPKRIRAVATVYDLVAFLFPQTMEFTNLLVLRTLLRPSLSRADHITVISETGGNDLRRLCGVAADRISVIPPGVASHFRPRPREEAQAHVDRVFGIRAAYALAVGTLEPRKNLITLIRAVRRLPRAVRSRVTVVVVGSRGWKNSALRTEAAPLVAEGAVRFLGYVPDADLPWLYAGAEALLFPSLYEGFGIPVVEAMACGTLVIASDIPVLREVAGGAAWFIPAADPARWADALATLPDGAAGHTSLVEAGFRRAERFTFDASARRMLQLWERLMS